MHITHGDKWSEQWRPERRQKITTVFTTSPQWRVGAHSVCHRCRLSCSLKPSLLVSPGWCRLSWSRLCRLLWFPCWCRLSSLCVLVNDDGYWWFFSQYFAQVIKYSTSFYTQSLELAARASSLARGTRECYTTTRATVSQVQDLQVCTTRANPRYMHGAFTFQDICTVN